MEDGKHKSFSNIVLGKKCVYINFCTMCFVIDNDKSTFSASMYVLAFDFTLCLQAIHLRKNAVNNTSANT